METEKEPGLTAGRQGATIQAKSLPSNSLSLDLRNLRHVRSFCGPVASASALW